MDDESGDSMEPIKEMPLKKLGEAELEINAWLTDRNRVGSRDEGKHT